MSFCAPTYRLFISLLSILFGLVSTNSFASTNDAPLDISILHEITDINQVLQSYIDEPPFERPEEIDLDNFKPFIPLFFHEIKIDAALHRYWFKLNLSNSGESAQKGYIFLGQYDRIFLYETIDKKGTDSQLKLIRKAGFGYKNQQQKEESIPYLLPVELKPDQKKTYVVHISTSSHIVAETNELIPKYVPLGHEKYMKIHHHLDLKKGIIIISVLTLIIFIFIFCLALSVINKDWKILSFALVCLSSFMYYLRETEVFFQDVVFWAHWDEMVQKTEVLFRAFMSISFLIFTHTYFKLGKYTKALRISTLVVCVIALTAGLRIYIGIGPFQHFADWDVKLYLTDIIGSCTNSAIILGVLWWRNENFNRKYVIGIGLFIFLSYGGLFLNLRFPSLTNTLLSSNLITIYAMFIFLSFMTVILYQNHVNIVKSSAETSEQLKLSKIKSNFYTNITHEFRTPLTVIKGAVQNFNDGSREKHLIEKHSQSLLNLVNEMMDLSSLEAEKLQLNLIQDDIVFYIRYIKEAFDTLANRNKVTLSFQSDEENIFMDFDENRMRHIINNLVFNAIKFTPEYGVVNIYLKKNSNHELKITVQDNGRGISQNDLPHIFERYFKTEKDSELAAGSGIGLTFVKELVELMGGNIFVSSALGSGTTFEITLPITNVAPMAKVTYLKRRKQNSSTPNLTAESISNEDILIQIVEDNEDVMDYICRCIPEQYKIITCYNGEEGLQMASRHIPNVIITDVMMPKMNGVEMSSALKNQESTSHIPIIMLTAKTDISSKLEGLTSGALTYLSKPFEKAELIQTIQNLLRDQQNIQQFYGKKGYLAPFRKKENEFITKVKDVIVDQMGDENFDVNILAESILMDRTQIYRKLKALTNQTPSQLIKEMRLQSAKRLLAENQLSIAEISYQCGFKDVSYFSKLFKKKYGKTPGNMSKNLVNTT